jgi:hypothetical protein
MGPTKKGVESRHSAIVVGITVEAKDKDNRDQSYHYCDARSDDEQRWKRALERGFAFVIHRQAS